MPGGVCLSLYNLTSSLCCTYDFKQSYLQALGVQLVLQGPALDPPLCQAALHSAAAQHAADGHRIP